MPVVQDIVAKEENDIAWWRSRGEISAATYKGLDVLVYRPQGRGNYYYASRVQKSMVALHYTAGYLSGDLDTLTTDNYHVSVPFVIARSGKIIQLFNPDYWSYHLSPRAVGGNEFNSKRAVAIEISSLGRLTKSGSWMWNYVGSKYCKVGETQYYHDLEQPYRGYRYYATFSGEQYKSLSALLDVVCPEYDIPRNFLAEPDRYKLFSSSSDARSYKGICSHVNYQPSGVKEDIGPAFEWPRIGA
ncbi:N-acetylmuramoyl-L-alanine amidase [Roseovarius aestuarii]|uniref:N-acetylmuramoyl-L-alanine amidase n=1 Tax=Roseovarius aestuarii TaxID=475083 RepID=A0A1X7BWI9_9RHOB|nr:N-acetylmuramoyl-L-alanine amidase [Roseovarius aestuarii]SMC14007.1 N-acetylmuramoyl-L-alanine amidase [Roseovarius aestuarii]